MHLQFWPAFSPSTSTMTTLHFQTEHVCPARHTTRLHSLWNRTKRTIYSRFYQVSCNKKIHDQHQLRIWDFERAVPTLVSHQLMVLVRTHKCRRLTAQAPCISCGGVRLGWVLGAIHVTSDRIWLCFICWNSEWSDGLIGNLNKV